MVDVRSSRAAPRFYIFAFLALVLILASATAWLGWRLLEQDRLLVLQRSAEARELAAGAVVVALEKRFVAAERDLASFAEGHTPAASVDTLFLRIASDRLDTAPGNLLYSPLASPLSSPPEAPALAEADRLEFAENNLAAALRIVTPMPAASALVRQARLLRKLHRYSEAAARYRRLSELGAVPVAGLPASLAGRVGELQTRELEKNTAAARQAAAALLEELAAARILLTRETYASLAEPALRLLGEMPPTLGARAALADAAQALWEESPGAFRFSRRWIPGPSGAVLVVSRATPGGGVACLVAESAFRREWLPDLAAIERSFPVSLALTTPAGQTVAGPRPAASGTTVRLAAVTQLPFNIVVWSPGRPLPADPRRLILLGSLALLCLAVAVALWLATRSVNRELELAGMKSEFVATVSHEFRTPLTTLRQLSELLVSGRVATDLDREEYYRLLKRESERLHVLVEKMLTFGRLEAGRLPLYPERFDAAQFTAAQAADFQHQPAANGYSIDCSSAVDAPVHADREALRLALWNLLENAVKYSPGASRVAVTVRTPDERVEIAVADQGPGIPSGEQERIFERFVRGSAATEGSIRGTGIGLALARDLMRAQGGDITLESEPGLGSTFTLVLPKAV